MSEIKPCPFCGGAAKLDETDFDGFYVFCPNCSASIIAVTKEKSVCSWNLRSDPESANFKKAIDLLTEERDALGDVVAEQKVEIARLKSKLAAATFVEGES